MVLYEVARKLSTKFISETVKRGTKMRLYISKEEAEFLSGLLIYEVYKRIELNANTDKQERLLNRIEECLQRQKSGYNRKEK